MPVRQTGEARAKEPEVVALEVDAVDPRACGLTRLDKVFWKDRTDHQGRT